MVDHDRVRRRRDREIVDGEAVVGVVRIVVDPADPEGRVDGNVEVGDDRGEGGVVRGRIAVARAGRAGRVGGREIERGDRGPGAGAEAGRVEAVLEAQL